MIVMSLLLSIYNIEESEWEFLGIMRQRGGMWCFRIPMPLQILKANKDPMENTMNIGQVHAQDGDCHARLSSQY